MSQFTLPDLAYEYDALEPHIDAKTMEIHHTKHHATYVSKLNDALKDHDEYATMELEDLMRQIEEVPAEIETAVRNNGGGHFNHSLFWQIMTPDGGGKPSGDLLKAIEAEFGSFTEFKEKLTQEATGRFGSGWAWLVVESTDTDSGITHSIHVCSTPNQDNPLMHGNTPILGVDVWEHAYYLNYQNRRPDYLEAWWNLVNWSEVEKRYHDALSQ